MKNGLLKKFYGVLILMLGLFISPSFVDAGVNHEFSLYGVKCPMENYVDLGDEQYYGCMDDYIAGDLDSYVIENGDDVDPGTTVMLALHYAPGTDMSAIAFNLVLTYDTTIWTSIHTGTSDYYNEDDFPKSGRSTKWGVEMNVPTPGRIVILGSDETNYLPLENEMNLYYVFLELNENVDAGKSISVNFGTGLGDNDLTDEAEDQLPFTTQDLTLSVYGSQSKDASLGSLSVENDSTTYPLSPEFVAGSVENTVYNAVVPNHISSITLNAEANNEYASIPDSQIGEKTLAVGNNPFSIIVTSQLGDVETYTVNVYRLSNDASLSNLTLSNNISIGTFASGTYSYTANDVPFATKDTTITATTTHENAFIKSGDGAWTFANAGSTPNVQDVIVNAENCKDEYVNVPGNSCTSKTYTVTVNRIAASSNNNLSSLTVDGVSVPDFNKDTTIYNLSAVSNATTTLDIDAIVEDTGKATIKSGTGEVNVNVGNNKYDIVVKAEDGTEKTYTINVRRLSNDTTLTSLTVTSDATGTLSPTFQASFTGNYTYTYNPTATTVTVSATVNDTDNARVLIADTSSGATATGTSSLNTATENFSIATTQVSVVVTAEDGTIRTYPIDLTRLKSSNNNLSDIKVDGTSIAGFTPGTQIYNVSVPGLTTEVSLSATLETPDKATILTDLSNPFSLNFGSNQIDIEVQAEDGNSKKYTVFVTREKGIDPTLKDLQVDGSTITGFAPLTESYTLTDVAYHTTSINVTGIPNDELATVSDDGLINLKTGRNEIVITVAAHNTDVTKTYTIVVNRELNDDTGITGITLAGKEATYNSKTGKYEVIVPNSVVEANSDNVTVDVAMGAVSTDPLATYRVTTTPLSTKNTNDVIITVVAEDGTEKNYTLVVTREKSNVATLGSLNVTNGSFNPSFNPNTFSYEVTVPVETTEFDVTATPSEPNANVTSGIGHYTMTASEKTVEVTVTSEDLSTTKTYTLKVIRTKSSDNTLSSITVSKGTLSPVFDPDTTSYTVDVAGSVNSIDVAAIVNDERATILSGTGTHNLNVGENTITIRVESESGAKLDYTIKVNRAQKEDNNLASLTVDGVSVPGFDPDVLDYTLDNVAYTKTSIDIAATASDTDAKISGTGRKGLTTGLNTFSVIVTAQNGSVKTYTIKITREKNNNAYLSLLSINGYVLNPNFAKETFDYEVTVASSKETLNKNEVTAIPEDSNATVVLDNDITLSTTVDNYYQVRVTSEDGKVTNTYTIKVIRPKSSDATLKSVNLTGATLSPAFNASKTEYTLTIPYGSTNFSIEGIPNDTKTQVYGNGNYTIANNVVTITTKAEDNTQLTYTFNVVEALSNDATLSDLNVGGYPLDKTFNSTTLSYDIGSIPFGTSTLTINATPTNLNSTIEYYVDGVKQTGNVVNLPSTLGTKTITAKVIAPDGDATKSYNITYTVVASSNAYLSVLTPSTGTIDFTKTKTNYEITVDNDVTSISFDINTEDDNATITVDGTTSFTPKTITKNLAVGNNSISILVTAQDGTTKQTYNVIVKRLEKEASTDANLSNLSVTGYPFDKDFDMDETEYSIGSIPFGVTELTVNATLNMGTSSINYLVNGVKQNSNVVVIPKTEGSGAITVQVTAEDGKTIKNYKITYNKTASSNAYLSNIVVSQGELEFNKNTFDYTVSVGRDVTSIDLTATVEDNNSIMKINGTTYTSPHTLTISPLNAGATEVTILVTAENGSVLTYKVTIEKDANPNETITSVEYGHTIANGYIKTVKLDTTGIEMKDQLDNENEYLEIWDAEETRKIEDNEKLATGMIVKLMIDGAEKDRKVIVIKGDTSGDGEIDLFDSVKILNDYLVRTPLTGAYLEAAYVNDDTDIDLFDSVMILNHYLGRISLH